MCVLQMRARVNGVCITHSVCITTQCVYITTHTHSRKEKDDAGTCVLGVVCVYYRCVWCVCITDVCEFV